MLWSYRWNQVPVTIQLRKQAPSDQVHFSHAMRGMHMLSMVVVIGNGVAKLNLTECWSIAYAVISKGALCMFQQSVI